MEAVVDFLKQLYRHRQNSDDPVLRHLYAIAEDARADPWVNNVRQVFENEMGVDGRDFDRLFAAYWSSLHGPGRDWNIEVEHLMREMGLTEGAIIAARTDFKAAVVNRIFLRIAMDRLTKSPNGSGDKSAVSPGHDAPEPEPSEVKSNLLEATERAMRAIAAEGARQQPKRTALARMLARSKPVSEHGTQARSGSPGDEVTVHNVAIEALCSVMTCANGGHRLSDETISLAALAYFLLREGMSPVDELARRLDRPVSFVSGIIDKANDRAARLYGRNTPAP